MVSNEFFADVLMTIMIIGSLFLAVVVYIPKFPRIYNPSWSNQFFSTVIVVIASKVVTVYAFLVWYLTDQAGTPHPYFVWGYFLCMLFGIFVYFNFGTSEYARAQTVRILESTLLAIVITFGILLFYSFAAWTAYAYWSGGSGKPIFLQIAVISAVDFFFFTLLWLRYWLQRRQITRHAVAYQEKNPV